MHLYLKCLLTSALILSQTLPALADRTDPDFVPPDVTLSLPMAPPAGSAAIPAASGSQYGAPGSTTAQAPGQVNMGNSAAGFAPGQMPSSPGQPNPFSMKPVDRMRMPPGSPIQGNQQPGGYPQQNPAAQSAQQTADPTAVIQTSKGTITIRLFKQFAPKTVAAFEEMARSGFYDGLTFHRVEPGFVVQGGCPQGNGTGNYIAPGTNQPRFLPLEVSPFVRHNAPGVVAMARQPHNKDSASCQFYITLAAKPQLDMQYTVFGGVLSGMDVVNCIAIGDRILSIRVSE